MLNSSSESGHPCLIPDFRGNALIFTIEDNVCCGFIISGFYYVEVCSFYACFLEDFFFLINECWIYSKGDQSWVSFGRNDAKAETPVPWPPHAKSWLIGNDPDAGLGAGEEGNDRGWDGWMTSLTRWTQVWVNSRSWWWTGRPGVLRFMWSQIVGHNWVTELNWTEGTVAI